MSATEQTTPDTEIVDLYREVHKGLRLALFDLVARAGSLDPSDPAAVASFAQLHADVDMMLDVHHAHEDGEALGALIAAHVPARVVAAVEADHDRFDGDVAELRTMVAELSAGRGDARGLYDSVSAFVAAYLGHMATEESQVMPALRAGSTPDELHAITMAIRTSVPPDQMCVFLRYMLPAMNVDERAGTLGGMKMGAPPEIFEQFWAVAEQCLEPADLDAVVRRMPG